MATAEDLQVLKAIALMEGRGDQVWISSQKLGEMLKTSPQTASRRLISLEKQRLITRSIQADGQYVTITKAGEEVLRHEYLDYCRIFEKKKGRYSLKGEVIGGLGEGRYYVSLSGYHHQFVEKLGFDPFPGTLNLRLDAPSIQIRNRLEALGWIGVEGFKADDRTFGDARCLPCSIEGYQCAIIVPGRTHYPEDVIEVISPVELRKALHLKERDRVTVEVAYD
jgi:riboflavin kinase